MKIMREPRTVKTKVQSKTVRIVDIILCVKRKWKHNGKLKTKTNGQPNMLAMKVKVKLDIKQPVELVERYFIEYLIEFKYIVIAIDEGNNSTEAWK